MTSYKEHLSFDYLSLKTKSIDQPDDYGGYSEADGKSELRKKDTMTPRTNYSKLLAKKYQNRVNLMMRLEDMESIRREFEHYCKSVNLDEFCAIILRSLNKGGSTYTESSFQEETEALVEIFKEIDINGDGDLTWEEFTSYLVTLANEYSHQAEDDCHYYQPSKQKDTSDHFHPVIFIKYFPGLDRIISFERSNRNFSVYSTDMKKVKSVKGHTANLLGACYLPENNQFVTSAADRTFRFWDTNSSHFFAPKTQWTLKGPQIALTWNSHTLYSSNTHAAIIAWNVERCEAKGFFTGHRDVAMDIAPFPALGCLVSASLDTTVRLWDYSTCCNTVTLTGHERGVLSMSISPQNLLITGGLDSYACVFNPKASKKPLYQLKAKDSSVHLVGVEIPSAYHEVILADNHGNFFVYDLRTMACVQSYVRTTASSHMFSSVTSTRTSLIAGGSQLYKFEKRKVLKKSCADLNPIVFAKYCPSSLSFFVAAGRTIKVWNALTGKMVREHRNLTNSMLTAMCFDSRSRRFITGEDDGTIKFFNASNAVFMKAAEPPHKAEVSSLLYCTERGEIYSSSWDNTVAINADIAESAKSTRVRVSKHHYKDVTAIALSSKCRLVASGSADCTVCIYDWGFTSPIGHPLVHKGAISAMLFMDNLPLLVVADQSGEVNIWLVSQSFSPSHVLAFINAVDNAAVDLIPENITCIAYDATTHVLVTGDDRGNVKMWRCSDFLPSIQEIHANRAQVNQESKQLLLEMNRSRSNESTSNLLPRITDVHESQSSVGKGSDTGSVVVTVNEKEVLSRSTSNSALSTSHSGNTPQSGQESSNKATDERMTRKYSLSEIVTPKHVVRALPYCVLAAHEDSVAGLDVIPDKQCQEISVLSWGYDGCVHIFGMEKGNRIASLLQSEKGEDDSCSHRNWKFEVNINYHLEESASGVSHIVDNLKTSALYPSRRRRGSIYSSTPRNHTPVTPRALTPRSSAAPSVFITQKQFDTQRLSPPSSSYDPKRNRTFEGRHILQSSASASILPSTLQAMQKEALSRDRKQRTQVCNSEQRLLSLSLPSSSVPSRMLAPSISTSSLLNKVCSTRLSQLKSLNSESYEALPRQNDDAYTGLRTPQCGKIKKTHNLNISYNKKSKQSQLEWANRRRVISQAQKEAFIRLENAIQSSGLSEEHSLLGHSSEHSLLGHSSEHSLLGHSSEHSLLGHSSEHSLLGHSSEHSLLGHSSEHSLLGHSSEHLPKVD